MKISWKKNKNAVPTELAETAGKKEKKILTPAQKKKRKKRIIMGVIAACLALFIVSRAFAPKVLPVVVVRSAEKGTVEQTIDTSGTIKTEKKVTYFSPLSAKISECKVATGDAVAAGEVLLVYDGTDLKEREDEAKLQNEEAYYTYQDSIGKSNEDASEYSRSSHDIEILEQQVKDWKEKVRAQKQYITDLGCHLREAQQKNQEKRMDDLQTDIDQANNALTVYEEELAEFESNLSEQKSIQSSSESAMLTASGRKQIEATKNLAALKAEKVTAAVAQVAEGLKAEFGGVVTDVKAVEGGVIEESGELLTIESNEDVCVEITLSKNDLEKVREGQKAVVTVVGKEYEGTVTRISKSATKNDKNASVISGEVHIDNPDADIYLGVEAKVKIQGDKAEDVLMVPVEAVNVGKEGSFVYIVDGQTMTVRNITTGLSSIEYMEVKEGLNGNEKIVVDNSAGAMEGMQVTPMEG